MPGSEPAARTCRSHLPGPRVQQLVTLQESGPKGASDGPQRSRILSGKTDSPHVGHLNARVSVCFRFSFLTLRSTEWETMFPVELQGSALSRSRRAFGQRLCLLESSRERALGFRRVPDRMGI